MEKIVLDFPRAKINYFRVRGKMAGNPKYKITIEKFAYALSRAATEK